MYVLLAGPCFQPTRLLPFPGSFNFFLQASESSISWPVPSFPHVSYSLFNLYFYFLFEIDVKIDEMLINCPLMSKKNLYSELSLEGN